MPYVDREKQLAAMRKLNKTHASECRAKGVCPHCGQPVPEKAKGKVSRVKAAPVVAAAPVKKAPSQSVLLKRCSVCHQESEELDVRGHCAKCR